MEKADIDLLFPEVQIFWKQVLYAWNEFANCDGGIRNPSFIWFNSAVRIDNQAILLFKSVIRKG